MISGAVHILSVVNAFKNKVVESARRKEGFVIGAIVNKQNISHLCVNISSV